MNINALDNEHYTISTISQNELKGAKEHLQARIRDTAKDSFFYLEMPTKCKKYLPAACDFAGSFHQNQTLKEMKLPGWSGYRAEENSQREHFFCEHSLWEELYPKKVRKLASIFSEMNQTILEATLDAYQVPKELWSKVTGGLTDRRGMEHFSFNHYRSNVNKIGINIHRDIGMLTLLYINSEGLKARIQNKKWVHIPPKEDHVVVNYGKAFEILINQPEDCRAAWHGVDHVCHDRISFGLFSDPQPSVPLYQMVNKEAVIVKQRYEEHVKECFSEIYAE